MSALAAYRAQVGAKMTAMKASQVTSRAITAAMAGAAGYGIGRATAYSSAAPEVALGLGVATMAFAPSSMVQSAGAALASAALGIIGYTAGVKANVEAVTNQQ